MEKLYNTCHTREMSHLSMTFGATTFATPFIMQETRIQSEMGMPTLEIPKKHRSCKL